MVNGYMYLAGESELLHSIMWLNRPKHPSGQRSDITDAAHRHRVRMPISCQEERRPKGIRCSAAVYITIIPFYFQPCQVHTTFGPQFVSRCFGGRYPYLTYFLLTLTLDTATAAGVALFRTAKGRSAG
jgi:hypothetical protein